MSIAIPESLHLPLIFVIALLFIILSWRGLGGKNTYLPDFIGSFGVLFAAIATCVSTAAIFLYNMVT